MKIGLIADVHVGNFSRFGGPVEAGINRRCRQVLNVLERACRCAQDLLLDHLVVLGDLFDSACPSPQVVTATRDALMQARCKVWLLAGNHDQVSEAPGDHALGPLHGIEQSYVSGAIRVVDQPVIHRMGGGADSCFDAWFVPFRTGPGKEWLPAALAELVLRGPYPEAHRQAAGRRPVLFTHLGIEADATPAFLRGAADSIRLEQAAKLAREHGFALVAAGNWHTRRIWTERGLATVAQVGALCPTGFSNPGLTGYGTLAVWDSTANGVGALTWEEIPGPRFLKVAGLSALEKLGLPAHRDYPLYVSATVGPEEVQEALAIPCGRNATLEVLPDGAEAEAAARTAAHSARSAGTLEEALAAYVAAMDLPAGVVDRAGVLELARRYLA